MLMKSQKPVLNKLFAIISYPFCHSKWIRFSFWRFASPKRVINLSWVWFSFKSDSIFCLRSMLSLWNVSENPLGIERQILFVHTIGWFIVRSPYAFFTIHHWKKSPACLAVLDCREKPHAKSSRKVGQQKLRLEVIRNNLWILFDLAYYAVAMNGTITCKLPRNWLIMGLVKQLRDHFLVSRKLRSNASPRPRHPPHTMQQRNC